MLLYVEYISIHKKNARLSNNEKVDIHPYRDGYIIYILYYIRYFIK